MSNIIRRYIAHTKLAVCMAFSFITFFYVLFVPFFYYCKYGCMFCTPLFNFVNHIFLLYVYIFLLLRLLILIVM